MYGLEILHKDSDIFEVDTEAQIRFCSIERQVNGALDKGYSMNKSKVGCTPQECPKKPKIIELRGGVKW